MTRTRAFASLLVRNVRTIVSPPPAIFEPTADDVFLVSFPRSGNTWMRVMISEMLYGESGDSIDDLQHYVPDIGIRTPLVRLVPATYHAVKSHLPYNGTRAVASYKRVLYIVRDPRDVVLSHYRYQASLGYFPGEFSQFVVDWVSGRIWPCSWQEHVNSWTAEGLIDRGVHVHVVRFEDLKVDPGSELGRVGRFLGVEAGPTEISRCVGAASLESMRLREKKGMREEETAEGFNFVGAGTWGSWRHQLTSSEVELIEKHAGTAMKRMGYVRSDTESMA